MEFQVRPRRQMIDYQLTRKPVEGMEMGEVIVKVKLTNPMDEAMVAEGFKTEDQIRVMEVEALVDRGAVNCVIPSSIADQMGLRRMFNLSFSKFSVERSTRNAWCSVMKFSLGRQHLNRRIFSSTAAVRN